MTAAERELVKKGDIKEDEIPWLRTLAQKYKQREEEVEKMNPPLKFWDPIDIIEPGRQGEDNQERQEEDELDEPAPNNNKSKKTSRKAKQTGVFKKAMKMFKRRNSVKQKEETMEIDLTEDDEIAAPSSSKKRSREDDRRGSLRSAQPKKKKKKFSSCFSVLDEEDFDD